MKAWRRSWRRHAGNEDHTAVLVSEIVAFESECRAFVLDGQVADIAVYEGRGDLEAAEGFVAEVARHDGSPRSVVVDVGHIAGRGWAVIEFNAAWGAGLNGCDAERVLPCLEAATRGQKKLDDMDGRRPASKETGR